MPLKGEDESLKYVVALFAQRDYVGADDAEGLGAGDGTETAGGFLLEPCIVARLGGWKGCGNERKPGPITMLHGLQALANIRQG